jgi:hypothetical protein
VSWAFSWCGHIGQKANGGGRTEVFGLHIEVYKFLQLVAGGVAISARTTAKGFTTARSTARSVTTVTATIPRHWDDSDADDVRHILVEVTNGSGDS